MWNSDGLHISIMATIILETKIKAPILRCFDLSRSIDLHKISTAHTNEVAIAGCTQGLIEFGEFVTWEAIHFGIKQKLSTKITEFNSPVHFKDEQIRGIFKFMKHDHFFKEDGKYTIMKDVFSFKAPLPIFGRLAEIIFVKKHLRNLLLQRNQVIKDFAESEDWRQVL